MKRAYAALNRFAVPVFLCILLIFLGGCYTVPLTGRQAMILLDEGTEMQMGASAYADAKKGGKISTDPRINNRVQQVGKRIAAATGLDYEWEFTVFDEPDTVNAFCLPGGKVGIYTGILKVTQNDAGLATVVAHEVAHATARHGAERYSQDMMLALGGAVIGQAVAGKEGSEANKEKWNVAFGLGSSLLVALPHSRMQESEADRMGLIYMAKAGYDPHEAVGLWERFKKHKEQQGQSQVEFLSTHPTDETRIQNIQSHLPEALSYYSGGGASTPGVLTATPAGLTAVPVAKPSNVVSTATMFLKAECPNCGKINRIAFSDYRGQSVRCFSCGKTFK